MKRSGSLGALLVSVFAVAAMSSAAAFGDETPLDLPFTANEVVEGSGQGSEFISSLGTITCAEASILESDIESNLPPLGAFHIDYSGCKDKGTGTTCTGLGEAGGVILTLGTWHLVWDKEEASFELHTATLFLISPVHFNCSIVVLVEAKGEQLCLDLNPEEARRLHSFHCIASGASQKGSWCKKDVEETCVGSVVPKLEASVNHAAFQPSAYLALGSIVTAEPIAAMLL